MLITLLKVLRLFVDCICISYNVLDTLKQFVGNLPTNCLSVFGHFMGLVLKGLIYMPFTDFLNILVLGEKIQ